MPWEEDETPAPAGLAPGWWRRKAPPRAKRPAPLPQRVDGTYAQGFVLRDGLRLAQDIAQFVDAVQETVLGELVHGEPHFAAGGRGERLGFQIDFHCRAGILSHRFEQSGVRVGRN